MTVCRPRSAVDSIGSLVRLSVRMIPLLRLTNDAGSSTTLSRMLARPTKVAEPSLGILLAKRSTDRLLRKARLSRTLLTARLTRNAGFLRHGKSPTLDSNQQCSKNI
jgi:hypothetical protein